MQPRYESVDALQKYLALEVFHYSESGKKAAGRALGTLVEVITFYLLESWGLRHSLVIEKALAEYGYPEITHNVEYTLHPVLPMGAHNIPGVRQSVSGALIRNALKKAALAERIEGPSTNLLKAGVLRNCCVVYRPFGQIVVAHLDRKPLVGMDITLATLHDKPYAMFECKRVGVEEGMKKGPQTIEKAKQGAYVAKSVSNLQRIRLRDGTQGGVLITSEKDEARVGKYDEILEEILGSDDRSKLEAFILTVGVVSNHGNWFSSNNMNKETKLLAQAYDWLLFLTDAGLADFINDLIVHPIPAYQPVADAFKTTYNGTGGGTRFTKTMMDFEADRCLHQYFNENSKKISKWFNVLAPMNRHLDQLRAELYRLRDKNWGEILK